MRLLSTLLYLTISVVLAAQSPVSICGTTLVTPDYASSHTRLHANKETVAAGIVTPRNTKYIPIRVHLAASDEGVGRISGTRILDQLCELNEDFAPYDMQFYLADNTFNLINSSALLNDHREVQEDIMWPARDSNAINVFVVDKIELASEELEDPDVFVAGYYHRLYDWIVLRASSVRANDLVLTHEVGHLFSLPHPFNGYEREPHNTADVNAPRFSPLGPATEFADGRNCETAGDFICDTPADYNNGLRAASCRLTANILDPEGNPIDPDEFNYMGYFSLCRDQDYRFSNQQVAIMNADYASENRINLRSANIPPQTPLGRQPVAIYPEPNGTSDYYDQVTFEWTPTSGATAYIFELSSSTAFSFSLAREILDSTSITLNTELLPNRTHYWRVRPFSAYEHCQDGLPRNFNFKTSDRRSTTDQGKIAQFQLMPNPIRNLDEVTLRLASIQPSTAQVRIVNAQGQVVTGPRTLELTETRQDLPLSLAQLPNGIYFVYVETDNDHAVQKLILAR